MGTTGHAMRLPASRARLWLAVIAGGMAAQAVLWAISEPSDLFSDFYKAYFPAGEQLWLHGPAATWETGEAAAVGFVNIPILAWLFVPLSMLGDPAAGWTFLALGVAAMAAAYWLLHRLGQLDGTLGALVAFAILANGPLVNSLREGNTTHIILLVLIVALVLWRAGEQYAAGLLFGLCALFKLPLMLIGFYFLVRRRWHVVAGGATMIGGAVLLSLLVFGIDINIGWYRNCVEPFMGGVIAAFNVQSVDGFLARLESGPAQLTEWTPQAAALWHKVVRSVVLAAMFVFTFVAIYRGGDGTPAAGRAGERDLLEFSTVLVLAVVTSPVSWSHYYLLLLLPWALHVGGRLGLPDDGATRWLMTGGMLLASLPVIMPVLEPGLIGALVSRTLVSAWLFGGLLMLAALLRGMLHAHQPAPNAARRAIAP